MDTLNASGIYEILNLVNGKRYIGQSVDIARRRKDHVKLLRRGSSCHLHLQAAWIKYGAEAFKFSALGYCPPKDLTFFEQAWMDALKPEYNVAPAAGSTLGVKQSPEARAKRSQSMLGKNTGPRKPEIIARIAAALRGKKHRPRSLEHRNNLSLAQRGKPRPQGSIEKMSLTKRGVPWSAARRAAQEARR